MKDTGISPEVRRIVLERDEIKGRTCCVYCGNPYGIQIAHYISRGRMGKGIPENLVCLCWKCHQALDNGSDMVLRGKIHEYIRHYLSTMYPDWNEKKLVVKKWGKE